MSIATELQDLNDNILDAYTVIGNKQGTVPANKNTANLDTAINSIPSPDKYDVKKRVDDYSTLRQGYQVPANYGGTEVTAIGKLALAYIYSYANGAGVKNVSFPNVTTIYEGGMQCAFGSSAYDSYTGAGVETINFDSLREVKTGGLSYAFLGCKVKTVSFPALETVGANALASAFSAASSVVGGTASFPALTNIPSSATSAFQSAFGRFPYGTSQTNGYVSFSFPNLVTVAAEKAFASAFRSNNLCTHIDFSSLTTVSGTRAFDGAFSEIPIPDLSVVFPELVTASGSNCFDSFASKTVVACFPKLKTVGSSAFYYAFRGNTTTTISFPELDTLTGTYAFNQVASGDSALTTVSFPKLVDIQSGINGTFSNAFNGCTSLSSADFSGLENILAQSTFSSAFKGCTSITKIGAPSSAQDATVDLSSLETIDNGKDTFREAFSGCASLTTADFPALTTVSGSSTNSQDVFYRAFNGCTSLTTVTFPALTEASAYYAFRQAFYSTPALTTVTFPLLSVTGTSSFQNAFEGCSSLSSISFPSLTNASHSCFSSAFTGCTSLTTMSFGISTADNYSFNNAFNGCTALTTVSFPNLTSARSNSSFASMLTGCSNVTVHFPAAMETTMSSWTDVRNGFGGTNTTVLFDL